jgi:hypothetical protein
MSKKFLSILLLGLCYQGINLASAKVAPGQVIPQCNTLISKCESEWGAVMKKKNPSMLCNSLLTTEQINKYPKILEYCKKDAQQVYKDNPDKIGSCHALVYMLHDTLKYNYTPKNQSKYCQRQGD